MNREQRIVKNTIAYTIGNFGSKVLAYIMVLVYTHYITSSELGYYDIIITTVSLLQPIILLMFDDGVYRWLVDDNQKNKREVLSTCLKTVFCTTGVSVIVILLLNLEFHFGYLAGMLVYLSSGLLYQIILNSVRGLSNTRLYATSGILNSAFLLVFEVIGIVILKMGIDALFISKALANILVVIFIYVKQKEFRGIVATPYNKELARDIAKYSLPLIPNNVSWWIVNSSDRYIILFFLGTAANGVYSIANKFPTIVTTVTGILYFAIQESMLKEYNASDRDKFYSNIFEKYYSILFAIVICGIPVTRIVIALFVGENYKTAWMFSGFLYLGTVYSALGSWLGIGYQISKETKRSVYSTVGAAFVNVVINVIFIKIIGLHAASFSTLIAYMFLLVIRLQHSKKYFELNIIWKKFILLNIISIVILILTFIAGNLIACFGLTLIATGIAVAMNKDIVIKIMHNIFRR